MQCKYIWGQINDRGTTLTDMMTPVVYGNYQMMGTRFMNDFQCRWPTFVTLFARP
ncbi:MAG: hypothetical protein GY826_31105 [Fuerstiella sp.]|nr:hypothetical protein [Fuerstiella sp.]